MSLVQIHDKGEDHLSSNERRIWNLVYHILVMFNCPVMYRSRGPNAPRKIDLYHEFFIPRNSPNKDVVIQYIIQELEKDLKEGLIVEDGSYFYGTKLRIYEFDGVDPYVDAKTTSEMAKRYVEYLKQKIKELQDKEDKTLH